jgi:hypothetical protein
VNPTPPAEVHRRARERARWLAREESGREREREMCENASAEAAFLQGAGPETSLSFAAGEDSCLSAGRLCPTQLLPEYIQHPPGRPPGILTLSIVKTPTSTTAQSTLNRALCCWRQTPKETGQQIIIFSHYYFI